jgi:cytochrome c
VKHLTIFAVFLALCACGDKTASSAAAPAPASKEASAPPASPEERGRKQFNECAVCHTAKAGEANRVGPNLFGVAGREAGMVEGFAYSKALTESDIVWTDENLGAFIENPQAFLRGNRMAYAGQRDPEKRADIIAYLKTLK